MSCSPDTHLTRAKLTPNPGLLSLTDISQLHGLELSPRSLGATATQPGPETVIVCIDVEAWERDASKITEVGVAQIRTPHIGWDAPSTASEIWNDRIESWHYIVDEHKHLVNKIYVKGCPNAFDFGTSLTQPMSWVQSRLREHLTTPRPGAGDDDSEHAIIAGYDMRNDRKMMGSLGIDIGAVGSRRLIDVQRLCSHKSSPRGLSKALAIFGIPFKNMHNAGNDATYTMQLLLQMLYLRQHNPSRFESCMAECLDVRRPQDQGPQTLSNKRRKRYDASVRNRSPDSQATRIVDVGAAAGQRKGRSEVEKASLAGDNDGDQTKAATAEVQGKGPETEDAG